LAVTSIEESVSWYFNESGSSKLTCRPTWTRSVLGVTVVAESKIAV
jgi:hypothetical protein